MEENTLVLEHERLDDLQNGYMLIQNPEQFCFGIDAVLLSWFASVKPGEKALDMGTGTGVVPHPTSKVILLCFFKVHSF